VAHGHGLGIVLEPDVHASADADRARPTLDGEIEEEVGLVGLQDLALAGMIEKVIGTGDSGRGTRD